MILEVDEDGDLGGGEGPITPAAFTEGDGILGPGARFGRDATLKDAEINLTRPESAVGGEIMGASATNVERPSKPKDSKPPKKVKVKTKPFTNPLAVEPSDRFESPVVAAPPDEPEEPDASTSILEQLTTAPTVVATDEDHVCEQVALKLSKTDIGRMVKMFFPGLGFPAHIHMPPGFFDECIAQVRLLIGSADSPVLRGWVRFARSCKNRTWSVPFLTNFIATGVTFAVIGARISAETVPLLPEMRNEAKIPQGLR